MWSVWGVDLAWGGHEVASMGAAWRLYQRFATVALAGTLGQLPLAYLRLGRSPSCPEDVTTSLSRFGSPTHTIMMQISSSPSCHRLSFPLLPTHLHR